MPQYKKIILTIKTIKWAVKNPKEAFQALESARIKAEQQHLVQFFREAQTWQQN